MTWCPAGATDSESDDLEDLGDFQPPITPEFDSQKNLVRVVQDIRTNTLLALQGGFGTFDEDPPRNMVVIRSKDCGQTWTQVADLGDYIGDKYWPKNDPNGEEVWEETTLYTTFFLPIGLSAGEEPGHWILMDYLGGFYVSLDDGETWSERAYAFYDEGVTLLNPANFFTTLFGSIGGGPSPGALETRINALTKAQDHSQVAVPYVLSHWAHPGIGLEFLGVRRKVGNDWEDSLEPNLLSEGGSGWSMSQGINLVLAGANGRWIVMADRLSAIGGWDEDFNEIEVPNVRINSSQDLAPNSWGSPFWLISREWIDDIYEGTANHLPSTDRRLDFVQTHARIKFVPMEGHPVGGRWWFMGNRDVLLFSDDNGETWDKSLCDHTGPEAAMHPILNWRSSHDLNYRFTPPKVLDIGFDPHDQGRLIAVGVTWDQEGIDNRLAVFSCSDDGGDTWEPVGQLPIRLSNIQSSGSSADFDSPATARHIFPCIKL